MSYQSGLTTVSGNVSTTVAGTLPSASSSQTLVKATAYNVASGTTVYTVTAGKTFYCLGCSFYNYSTAKNMALAVDGTNVIHNITTQSGPTGQSNGGIVFTAAAGKAITIVNVTDAAGNNVANIWGYEA